VAPLCKARPVAEPLKNFFDTALVGRIADSLHAAAPDFDRKAFVRAVGPLDELELLGRARRVAEALAETLPADFERAAALVEASLDAPLPALEGAGMAPFFYLPHVLWVAEAGLAHFETAMRLQHALTQRFTAEFSIRAYLVKHPEATLARLREWTRDPSHHVRRLVSEGSRPRLPWAMRLRAFQQDPTPLLPLLDALVDDPSLYVRRSVANNVNDIAKDHPDVAVALAAKWMRAPSEERAWVVKHALRSLVKQGHVGALAVLGVNAKKRPTLRVEGELSAARVPIGGKLAVSVTVTNPGKTKLEAIVDLAVHFVKASGEAKPKVFKLRRVALAAGESVTLAKTISFAEHTTRTPRPGAHTLEVLVNGFSFPLGTVEVMAPKGARR
jgi:3-methyladenine DNA glycosylase AlkC